MTDLDASEPGLPTRRPNPRLVQAGAVILLACMVFFFVDLVDDLFEDSVAASGLTVRHILHMTLEGLSVLGLGFAAVVLFGYVRFLRHEAARRASTISLLRGRFREVLEQKFDTWSLTPAERDVAILILKGASVAEIAEARQTAVGTVKSQSTALFRKVGVNSRNGLTALFLDEFLDVAE